jgi:hypothetical protein
LNSLNAQKVKVKWLTWSKIYIFIKQDVST